MKQIEIEYFWPLTEQVSLDLDFTQCSPHLYYVKPQGLPREGPFATGTIFVADSSVTNTTVLNGWDIGKKQEPSWFRKMIMKYLIGWKWNG